VFITANLCERKGEETGRDTGISASNENEEEVEMIHRQDCFLQLRYISVTYVETDNLRLQQ